MRLNKIILLTCLITLLSCKSVPRNQTPTELAQSQGSNPGHDVTFTVQEMELLNRLLENSRDTFNFEGKKIAFITGSGGSRILSKNDFFNTCINPWVTKGDTPQISLVLLEHKEKEKSGGYDALVLSWVKVFTEKQKKRIVEKLAQSK